MLLSSKTLLIVFFHVLRSALTLALSWSCLLHLGLVLNLLPDHSLRLLDSFPSLCFHRRVNSSLKRSHRIKSKSSPESAGCDPGVSSPSPARVHKCRTLCSFCSEQSYSIFGLKSLVKKEYLADKFPWYFPWWKCTEHSEHTFLCSDHAIVSSLGSPVVFIVLIIVPQTLFILSVFCLIVLQPSCSGISFYCGKLLKLYVKEEDD